MTSGIPKSGINKGWFKKGSQVGKEYWFKKGHPKPKNAYKFLKGKQHPYYGKKKPDISGRQKGIKNPMYGRIPWNKGKEFYQIKGEKNHAWKGGITPEHRALRASSKNDWWVKDNLEKNNYTCQKCGLKGGKLCVHHIQNFADYSELRFEIDNGITFCIKCHKLFHKIYGNIKNNKQQIYDYLSKVWKH